MTTTTLRAPDLGRQTRLRLFWLCVVLGLVAICCALSIAIGARNVGFGDIVAAFGGATDTIEQAAIAKRIPRTVLAALAGAALGLAGAVMQGVTRNPLAEPGILGVNMGAALAVVIGLAWFGLASAQAYIWTAILGAGLTAVFVFAIGSLGRGGPTPLKLALAGTATTIALASFVTAVILPRNDIAEGARSWQIGGVGGTSFATIWQVVPFLVVGFGLCLLSARKLNSLALGDDLAAGLGENVVLARWLASLGAVILAGATTAVCGPISFVGLLVPHICRLIVGVDHRWLLPFSALGGAILLLSSDVIGRTVARPGELDVGIVTAFVGAPVFIWIVQRYRGRDL
nr:iron ABC transporter permease [Devosia aurantiaca]